MEGGRRGGLPLSVYYVALNFCESHLEMQFSTSAAHWNDLQTFKKYKCLGPTSRDTDFICLWQHLGNGNFHSSPSGSNVCWGEYHLILGRCCTSVIKMMKVSIKPWKGAECHYSHCCHCSLDHGCLPNLLTQGNNHQSTKFALAPPIFAWYHHPSSFNMSNVHKGGSKKLTPGLVFKLSKGMTVV